MAEHPNVERLKKGYEAFATGDMDTLRDLFAEDIVWHVPGHSPISGHYKGRDEVFAFFVRIAQETGGSFRLEIHDLIANDEHSVVLVRATAERGGKRLDQNGVNVFHVRDGKTTEFWGFTEDQQAADEFWS